METPAMRRMSSEEVYARIQMDRASRNMSEQDRAEATKLMRQVIDLGHDTLAHKPDPPDARLSTIARSILLDRWSR
jgi:hypothetical protein